MVNLKRQFLFLRKLEKPIHEKCGIVAVWDRGGQAVFQARKALAAIQHRGQESAGITVYKKSKGLITHKGMGLVAHVLTDDVVKRYGSAKSAIAHNRYSTTGNSSLVNAHPVFFKKKPYAISIGHNGNIPDTSEMFNQLKKKPKATSDTALLAALLLENRDKYSS
jgi:amidophosphoribosyltransferase